LKTAEVANTALSVMVTADTIHQHQNKYVHFFKS